MDINNDATFVAPEGVYSLRDELKSPLIAAGATTAAAWTQYPTRVSTITIRYPLSTKPAGFQVGALLGMGSRDKRDDREREKELDKNSFSGSEKDRTDEDNTPDTSSTTEPNGQPTPAMPPLFTTAPAPHGKKAAASKPRHNIRTTSSSFVTRMVSLEGINKYLQVRILLLDRISRLTCPIQTKQGDVTYLFYNHGRSFFWTEPSTKHKVRDLVPPRSSGGLTSGKDPLGRITFSHPPTCHAVNTTTASPSTIDILIAFPTGDVVWFDAISSRYVRLNKAGVVNGSCITAIKWVNGSSAGFATAHRDGSIIIWERERDDPQSNVWPEKLKEHESERATWNSHTSIMLYTPPWRLSLPTSPLSTATPSFSPSTSLSPTLLNGNTPISPAETTGHAFIKKDKQLRNPVSYWQLSTRAILGKSPLSRNLLRSNCRLLRLYLFAKSAPCRRRLRRWVPEDHRRRE
jgi:catabolite repression protein CreC